MTTRARKAAGRRGGKAKTSAKKAAARANGKKGGRPRPNLSAQFADLGAAPMSDPLAMNEWAQRVNARMLELIISGKGNRELVQHIVRLTRGIIGTTPMERVHQAQKKIRDARAPRKPVARKGPEVTSFDAGNPGTGGGTSLRR